MKTIGNKSIIYTAQRIALKMRNFTGRKFPRPDMMNSIKFTNSFKHVVAGKLSKRVKGPAGARPQAYENGDMCLWAAICPPKVVDYRESRSSKDANLQESWAAVERNEAKAFRRNALRRWHVRRLREKANLHPWARPLAAFLGISR